MTARRFRRAPSAPLRRPLRRGQATDPPAIAAWIAGTTANPTHGPCIEIGSTVSAALTGAEATGWTWQWLDGAAWTDLAGETAADHTGDAGEDGLSLRCVVAHAGGSAATPARVVRQAPPTAAGGLADRLWRGGDPIAPVDAAADFTGAGLSFALAPGSAALPDGLALAADGTLSGTPTGDVERAVVIRGSSTGGSADSGFTVIVDSTAPAIAGLSFSDGELSFELTEAVGATTLFWATAPDAGPSDAQIVAGSGGGIHEAGSYAVEPGPNADPIALTATTPAGARMLLLVVRDDAGNAGRRDEPVTVVHPPAAMAGDTHFSAADLATGGDCRITLDAAPELNGGTLLRYDYRVGAGGSWAEAAGLIAAEDTFDASGLTDGVATDIYLRAVTEAGAGPDGSPDSVTTTAGGTGIAIVATHSQTVASATGTEAVPIPGSPQQDDIVLVARSWDGANDIAGAAGYTAIVAYQGSNPNLIVEYKRMGASPDSAVAVPRLAGGAQYVQAVAVWLLRGVHATTAADVDPVPDPAFATSATQSTPAIATATDGAMIFRIAALDDDADVTVASWPAGFTLGQLAVGAGQTSGNNATVAGCARILATAGTDAAANLVFSASDDGIGVALAFRPA